MTTTSEKFDINEFNDDFFEWEERDENTPYVKHMIAGSIAGVVEHCCLFPLDSIKTQMQTLKKDTGLVQIARSMYKEGGLRRFWRGVSVMASGCVPAHALYFSVYEGSKKSLITNFGNDKNEHLLFGLSGALATLTHDFILTPMDTMKQRIQIAPQHIKNYRSLIRFTYQVEGLGAFYRSYPITTFMNVPNAAILVGTNETLKQYYKPQGGHTLFSYLLCGLVAGSTAAFATIPLDVIKTKLQCQNFIKQLANPESFTSKENNQFNNMFEKRNDPKMTALLKRAYSSSAQNRFAPQTDRKLPFKLRDIKTAISSIYYEEGLRGFVKGVGPRMAAMAPASAISWTTYEMVKKFLNSTPRASH